MADVFKSAIFILIFLIFFVTGQFIVRKRFNFICFVFKGNI